MDASLALQYLAVAAIVALALWVFAKKQFPAALKRLRVALAVPLVREGRPAWMRSLGRTIAPPSSAADGGCGGCNGCDPPRR